MVLNAKNTYNECDLTPQEIRFLKQWITEQTNNEDGKVIPFSEVVELTRYEEPRCHYDINKENIIQGLCVTIKELGRFPTTEEIKQSQHLPDSATVYKYLGNLDQIQKLPEIQRACTAVAFENTTAPNQEELNAELIDHNKALEELNRMHNIGCYDNSDYSHVKRYEAKVKQLKKQLNRCWKELKKQPMPKMLKKMISQPDIDIRLLQTCISSCRESKGIQGKINMIQRLETEITKYKYRIELYRNRIKEREIEKIIRNLHS